MCVTDNDSTPVELTSCIDAQVEREERVCKYTASAQNWLRFYGYASLSDYKRI